MFVTINSREISGAARSRLAHGVSFSQNRTERMSQQCHKKKKDLGNMTSMHKQNILSYRDSARHNHDAI